MTDADLPGSQSSHMGIFEDVCLYSTIFASSPVLPVLPEAGETRINLRRRAPNVVAALKLNDEDVKRPFIFFSVAPENGPRRYRSSFLRL